jgi:hypothetical protein
MSSPVAGPGPSVNNAVSVLDLSAGSADQLLAALKYSQNLSRLEQRILEQMCLCVAAYGIDNDQALFEAADHCFDVNFGGAHVRNIITVADYAAVMGEEVQETLGGTDCISADFFAHSRPGFFLLNPDQTIYFVKEGADRSLVYYDFRSDDFADSAQLPIQGTAKIVVLNKSTSPALATYFNTPTPLEPVDGKFYHEQQDGRKCGIHATHAFVGFPVVDETMLSLCKLEQLVNLECQQHRHRAPGQIAYYKSKARFEFAQSNLFQADLGNNADQMHSLLLLLASGGKIDPKYLNARTYELRLGGADVEYAASHGLAVENQDWFDGGFLSTVIEIVDKDLAKDQEVLTKLDQQMEEMRKRGVDAFHPEYNEYVRLLDQRMPFDNLESRKERTERNLKGLAALKQACLQCDRLFVGSTTEDHCFTLRKFSNNDWIVVDSMDSDQMHVEDPFIYLITRMKTFFKVAQHCSYSFISL